MSGGEGTAKRLTHLGLHEMGGLRGSSQKSPKSKLSRGGNKHPREGGPYINQQEFGKLFSHGPFSEPKKGQRDQKKN